MGLRRQEADNQTNLSLASSVMGRMGGNRWEKETERWEENVSGYGPGTCNSKKFPLPSKSKLEVMIPVV